MPRRSRDISHCAILMATSLALLGCEQRRDCVDRIGRKQPDGYCNAGYGGAHFVYGGRGGSAYGDTVEGGSVARGGFGGGGEGGEGGGHGGFGE